MPDSDANASTSPHPGRKFSAPLLFCKRLCCISAFRWCVAAGAIGAPLPHGSILAILHHVNVGIAITHWGSNLCRRPGGCNRACHQRQCDQERKQDANVAHVDGPLNFKVPRYMFAKGQFFASARGPRSTALSRAKYLSAIVPDPPEQGGENAASKFLVAHQPLTQDCSYSCSWQFKVVACFSNQSC